MQLKKEYLLTAALAGSVGLNAVQLSSESYAGSEEDRVVCSAYLETTPESLYASTFAQVAKPGLDWLNLKFKEQGRWSSRDIYQVEAVISDEYKTGAVARACIEGSFTAVPSP